VTESELCAYWTNLRVRVAAMAAVDTDRLIFGAHLTSLGHRYEILQPVPEESLRRFEARNRLRIPLAYRTFLLHYGAGGAGPGYGIVDFSRAIAPHDFTVPFPYTDTVDLEEHHTDDHLLWKREGLGYLGTLGCGIDWYIELNGPQRGTVWCDGDGAFYRYEAFQVWMDRWATRIERGLGVIVRYRELTRQHAAGGLTLSGAEAVLGPEISRREEGEGTWRVRLASGGGDLRCDADGAVLSVVGPRKGGIGS
jgi:hypothetical protein